jgi:predicted secreted hydrolase
MKRGVRVALSGCSLLAVLSCTEPPPAAEGGATDPAQALSRDPAPGFERIVAPRPFVFPEDYGPHPETQTEWWYVTGNLSTEEGRRFGYQFTIFRLGLTPRERVVEGSAWAVGDLYMAHLAVSDIADEHFMAEQRLTRPALELAGAQATPFRVWLEGWELESTGPDAFFPLSLDAVTTTLETPTAGSTIENGGVALNLVLGEGKPIVLHGDRGYSPKGANTGDASHYYSFTRMPTQGTLTINGESYSVSGDSWLDREWSTSVLSRSQRGWDWFGLQLSDGRELMLFELRSDDPSSAVVEGTLIERDGSTHRLERSDVVLTVVDRWSSDVDGAVYPSEWQLELPNHGINLRIESAFGSQEHTEIFRYWEGSVNLTSPDGVQVGRGYAELTGYAAEGREQP